MDAALVTKVLTFALTCMVLLATVGQVFSAIDNFVHRRDRKVAALEYATSGKASLQNQLEELKQALADLKTELTRKYDEARVAFRTMRDTDERLRLERAGILAEELAEMHDTLKHHAEYDIRIARLEEQHKALANLWERWKQS